MLYCAGNTQRDMSLACSVFDAARIGGDIFRWEEFITQCVDKLYKYYSMHTVVCNNDPDNVILREKFNTYDQAVTRACLVSMLGLPFTLGDNLPELPEDRVEILKRTIPPVPAHPMDIRTAVSDHNTVLTSLCIERPDMSYTVLDAINLREDERSIRIDIETDLHMDASEGPFHVYDYWNNEYLGLVDRTFDVTLRACASRVFAIHPAKDVPQVISTSRHISQGALDIVSVAYDPAAKALKGRSKVIKGDVYSIVAAAPKGLRIFSEGNHTTTAKVEKLSAKVYRASFIPEETGEMDWEIGFQPARD